MPRKTPLAFTVLGLTNMEGRRGAANVTTLGKMSLELNWRLGELIPIAVNGKPDCQGSRWLQLPCKEQHALCYVPRSGQALGSVCSWGALRLFSSPARSGIILPVSGVKLRV